MNIYTHLHTNTYDDTCYRTKHKVVENKTSYKTHLKLTVLQLTESDLGTYGCTATNTLGKAEGTVRVYGK